ncbi:MAG: YajQ family cyclic di-GMP-binding protein [Cyanobacteriota bacterium]
MAKDATLDIVSKVDLQEVKNAINQVEKELVQRFDLKGTGCKIEWDGEAIVNLTAPDDMKIKNVFMILQEKLIKRGISIKTLEEGNIEHALGGAVKQEITIKQGIDKDYAKKINTIIKGTKLKVNSQIQEDQLRLSGKSIDDLREVMRILKESDLDIDLQYINFRS